MRYGAHEGSDREMLFGDRLHGTEYFVILLMTLVTYIAFPNARPDFTRFNCHDSEAYCALAHSLVNGRGYTRSMNDQVYIGHRLWPPGMPLLLTPAIALSGTRINWLFVKCTVIIIGLAGALGVRALVNRVWQNRMLADLAAAFVVLNPYYWDFSHQAMAEVPTITYVFWSLFLIDRVFANRNPSLLEIWLSSLVVGIGMLIKGNVAGLAFAPLAHISGLRKTAIPKSKQLSAFVVFILGFSIPFVLWTARNTFVQAEGFDGVSQVRMIFQRSVTDTTLKTPAEFVDQIYRNLRWYGLYRLPEQIIPGLWWPGVFEWTGSGWLAIALTFALVWMAFNYKVDRDYYGIDLVLFVMIMIFLPYSEGGAARYWICVSIPLSVLIMVRSGLGRWYVRSLLTRYSARMFLLACLCMNLVFYVIQHERMPYSKAGDYTDLVKLFDNIAQDNAKIIGVITPHPCVFQLMTGQPAVIPAKGYDPFVSHIIEHQYTRRVAVPNGSLISKKEGPWVMWELSQPMRLSEVLRIN